MSRLAEAEFHLSQLNSRLEEEKSRREVAEEAMRVTEQKVKRYKRKVQSSNPVLHERLNILEQLNREAYLLCKLEMKWK